MPLTYEEVRIGQIAQRRESRVVRQIPGLLCFVSTVWNTPRVFLRALADSVFSQDGGQLFEWLILDNGTSDSETLAELAEIAKLPFVRFHRVEKNLGIIGGMRWVLDAATARYILPLDSDDLLTTDCVLTMTRAIVAGDYPALLYSDEDLLDGDRYFNAYYKSDFDPVLFVNSCYIAHLCAIDRARALALGCYSDPETEGSHDWDSFTRFMNAGYTPVHVADMVYAWRVHQQSTSGNMSSKPFVFNSQTRVLQRFIDAQARPQDFEVVPSPLFAGSPDWWIRRTYVAGTKLLSIVLSSDSTKSVHPTVPADVWHHVATLSVESDMTAMIRILDESDPDIELIHFTYADANIEREEWLRDAVGQFDLFSDAVMIGGIVHDGAQVTSASNLMGFGRGYDSPDAGRSLEDTGYLGAQMKKQRSAGAVSLAHCIVKRGFLSRALRDDPAGTGSLPALSLWLGAIARDSGQRVIFSPFFRCRMSVLPEAAVTQAEVFAILSMYRHRVPERELYSRHLGLSRATAYEALLPADRAAQGIAPDAEKPEYGEWLAQELKFRSFRYPVAALTPTIGIMTTVYPGSDWLLLDELYLSLSLQTRAFDEWVVVASGTLNQHLLGVLDKIKAAPRTIVDHLEQELPISQSMRRQFGKLSTDYTIPVDADDLLTLDALHILTSVISRNPSVDMVYSDEDLLIEGQPRHPYSRPDFDPVLNDETSYIWHLAAIRRETGLRLNLYDDELATWTHDWDTAQRMQADGATIVHVPEVLYHWRQHPKSLSNSGVGNTEQMKSVRHVLERRIARTARPENFFVKEVRFDRGGALPELFIARKADHLSDLYVISPTTGDDDRSFALLQTDCNGVLKQRDIFATLQLAVEGADLAGDSLLAVIDCDIAVDDWLDLRIEATRLFELHDQLVGVGGRIVGSDGVIVESCKVVMPNAETVQQHLGMTEFDAGPYALALKAHSVASLTPSLALFRGQFISSGRFDWSSITCIRDIVDETGRAACSTGLLMAYSPVVVGRTVNMTRRNLTEHYNRATRRLGLSGAWFHRMLLAGV